MYTPKRPGTTFEKLFPSFEFFKGKNGAAKKDEYGNDILCILIPRELAH